jgi:hypothetical protein
MTALPLATAFHDLDPAAVPDEYERRGLAALPDDRLFETAATVVAEPKAGPADSLVLHAPLELLVRRALLGYVDPARRRRARIRLLEVVAAYERAGDPVRPPDPTDFDSVPAARRRLTAAAAAGDLDGVDDAAAALAAHATAADLAPLDR